MARLVSGGGGGINNRFVDASTFHPSRIDTMLPWQSPGARSLDTSVSTIPRHICVRSYIMTMAMPNEVSSRVRSHSPHPRKSTSRVERRPNLLLRRSMAPTALPREWEVMREEFGVGPIGVERSSSTGGKRCGTSKQGRSTGKKDMVEPKVPHRREGLAECNQSSEAAYDSPHEQVVPIEVFVDCRSCRDEESAKERSEKEDHLPVRRVVRTHDLQLSVEIQSEVEQTCPSGGRVASGH